jgi:isopentenyl-diphosphate Delta-isomerase
MITIDTETQNMKARVILVDQSDRELGSEEKIKAHQEGLLHRAFSIFIFNSKCEMLIHRRALHKYHSGGLWTNACCSHPYFGESLEKAASRRLQEEMGFDCHLKLIFNFIYKAHIQKDNLIEHELDHVFFGITNQIPNPNPQEIAEIAWIPLSTLIFDVQQHPEKYTQWFVISLERVLSEYRKNLLV